MSAAQAPRTGPAETTVSLSSDAPAADGGHRIIVTGLVTSLESAPAALQQQGVGQSITFQNALATEGGTTAAATGVAIVELKPGDSLEDAVGALAAQGLSAIPDYEVRASEEAPANDPRYSDLYGMNLIDAPAAWATSTGNASTVVAVIDSGIDYTHPDLAANMWRNPGEIASNGVDDDSNGFVDDVFGYNFHSNTGNPFDDNAHGTHVAGTIGAVGNNGVGVTGVNWRVSLMALKVLNASGSGSTSNVLRALNYAVAMGVKISNMSLGGAGDPAIYQSAMTAARAAGHLVVAAAGNEGSNNDNVPQYPASYPADNMLAVCATDGDDWIAGFSNYGRTSVHLCAPGVSILSTFPGGMYATSSGTSMATPHVAGAAALLKSFAPSATYLQIVNRITRTVDVIPLLDAKNKTSGRLSVGNAIAAGPFGPVVVSAVASSTTAPVTSVTFTFNTELDPSSFTRARITAFRGPGNTNLLNKITTVSGSGRVYTVSFQGVSTGGTYEMTLSSEVTDQAGTRLDGNQNGVAGESADSYVASFPLPQAISLTVSGPGTVSSSPSGISSCTGSCSHAFAPGTVVTLTAASTGTAIFSGWGGACSGRSSTCQVTMSGNKTVTAAFTAKIKIAVTKRGSGGGNVSSSPAGISCGSTCSADITAPSGVTLTAVANSTSTFVGWTGCPSPSGATCVVPASAIAGVEAQFDRKANVALTVAKSGTGSGTVTGGGISCGATCSVSKAPGTSVTLSANAAAGSRFNGWSGCPSANGTSCTVAMSAATTVTADFAVLGPYLLTVSKNGTGSGTISSSAVGIACGSTCSAAIAHGTSVVLTAAPSATSAFGGWTNCPARNGNTCTLTVTADTSVTATFTASAPANATLSVVKSSGTADGGVISSPAGIACGAACSTQVSVGSTVVLTPVTPYGATFGGWMGCTSETGNDCSVTVASDTRVYALFLKTIAIAFTDALTSQAAFGSAWEATTPPAALDIGISSGTAGVTNVSVGSAAAFVAGRTFPRSDILLRFAVEPTVSDDATVEAIAWEQAGVSYRGGVTCTASGACSAYLARNAAGISTRIVSVALPDDFPQYGVLRFVASGSQLTLLVNGKLMARTVLGVSPGPGRVGLSLSRPATAARFVVSRP